MAHRQSPRGSLQLRTSSGSESDPLHHHRSITDRDRDRRSPRGAQSDSVNQKKLGTRIAGLESQLGQAQEELKNLKLQLASAEAAKKEAQQELDKKATVPVTHAVEIQAKCFPAQVYESNEIGERETEESEQGGEEDEGCKTTNVEEPEKVSFQEIAMKENEINVLEAKLEEREKQLEGCIKEIEGLKKQLNEAGRKEEDMGVRLSQLGEDLKANKAKEAHLKEKLEAGEGVKKEMEAEMKRLRVQTEQWRKAAEAAAAVLGGGEVEMMNGRGRRMSEKWGSMDKRLFQSSGGGWVVDDFDENDNDDAKRKGSAIKMFGDLWKKKSHK